MKSIFNPSSKHKTYMSKHLKEVPLGCSGINLEVFNKLKEYHMRQDAGYFSSKLLMIGSKVYTESEFCLGDDRVVINYYFSIESNQLELVVYTGCYNENGIRAIVNKIETATPLLDYDFPPSLDCCSEQCDLTVSSFMEIDSDKIIMRLEYVVDTIFRTIRPLYAFYEETAFEPHTLDTTDVDDEGLIIDSLNCLLNESGIDEEQLWKAAEVHAPKVDCLLDEDYFAQYVRLSVGDISLTLTCDPMDIDRCEDLVKRAEQISRIIEKRHKNSMASKKVTVREAMECDPIANSVYPDITGRMVNSHRDKLTVRVIPSGYPDSYAVDVDEDDGSHLLHI